MGIRLYFERISSEQYFFLSNHRSEEAYRSVIAQYGDIVDNWQFFGSGQTIDFQKMRRLIIEKFYWRTLLSLLTTQANDTSPVWDILGKDKTMANLSSEPSNCAQFIGNFWMGYSPLYYITPNEVSKNIIQLQQFDKEVLEDRFYANLAQEETEISIETQRFFNGVFSYHEDLIRFMKEARRNNEAILWYIS